MLDIRVVFAALLSSVALAQSPADGYRLFGPITGHDDHLVDRDGVIVHTWTSSHVAGTSAYLDADGTLLRAYDTMNLPNAGGGLGGGLERLALDGSVLWDFHYDSGGKSTHHDIDILPNGNILMIAWESVPPSQAVAMGRDPALIAGTVFRPDHVIEVKPTPPTGGIVAWEWHVKDHLIQDVDPTKANYGVVGDHPELLDVNFPPNAEQVSDFNHCNGIDHDPVHDLIVISAHAQDEIWIIDHSTTTAEAAGHTGGARGRGGDILYRWGNPASYRAGTAAGQQLFGQHDPTFVPAGYPGAGHIVLFNNQAPGGSRVDEIELPQAQSGAFTPGADGIWGPIAPIWSYSGGFHSNFISSARRLPNGDTLICSGAQGLLLEVSPAGNLVWSHSTGVGAVFHASFCDRELWASAAEVSVSSGGTVSFDVIAGSANGLGAHLLLGSATGTGPGVPLGAGVVLPLVSDAYTAYTVAAADTAPFLVDTLGTLDVLGRHTATLVIPPAVLPPSTVGMTLHHASLVVGISPQTTLSATNPVSVDLVP